MNFINILKKVSNFFKYLEPIVIVILTVLIVILTVLGTIYASQEIEILKSPFEPEISIGNWALIGTAGYNDENVPLMAINFWTVNRGARTGFIQNLFLEVNITKDKEKFTKCFLFKPYAEVERITQKKPLNITDVFSGFSVEGNSYLLKRYGFILEHKFQDLPKPPYNITISLFYKWD